MSLLVFIIAAAQFGFTGTKGNVALAAEKSMAQKPYMGWSSYSMQVYDGAGNWTSTESIKNNRMLCMRICKPMGMNTSILMRAGMAAWMNTADRFQVRPYILTDFKRSSTMFIIMDRELESI